CDLIVVTAMHPIHFQRRGEARRDAEFAAASRNPLLGVLDLYHRGSHGRFPSLVVVELKLAAYLVLEVGEQFGAALLGRAFENLLALRNQTAQIIALGFADGRRG